MKYVVKPQISNDEIKLKSNMCKNSVLSGQ